MPVRFPVWAHPDCLHVWIPLVAAGEAATAVMGCETRFDPSDFVPDPVSLGDTVAGNIAERRVRPIRVRLCSIRICSRGAFLENERKRIFVVTLKQHSHLCKTVLTWSEEFWRRLKGLNRLRLLLSGGAERGTSGLKSTSADLGLFCLSLEENMKCAQLIIDSIVRLALTIDFDFSTISQESRVGHIWQFVLLNPCIYSAQSILWIQTCRS